jgi:hypothetical protein
VPPKDLPPNLKDFISRFIHSVEQLEILLLVCKDPDRAWSAEAVYQEILSSQRSVERWLAELARQGLLDRLPESEGAYRSCRGDDLRAQISDLAEFYHTAPVRIIEAIYKREANAAQSFADAFKIKNTEDQS